MKSYSAKPSTPNNRFCAHQWRCLLVGLSFAATLLIVALALYTPSTLEHTPRLYNSTKSDPHKTFDTPDVAASPPHNYTTKHKQKSVVSDTCVTVPKCLVMAVSYYDQQTSAVKRFRSLHCWAGEVSDCGFIMPVIVSTYLGVPASKKNQIAQLGDIYDISQLTSDTQVASLVNWESVKNCTIKWKVILVHIDYGTCTNSKELIHFRDRFLNSLANTIAVIHQEITVCLEKEGVMSSKSFAQQVFGNVNKMDNTIVVFTQWRGLSGHFPLVNDSHCHSREFRSGLPLSPRMLQDTHEYIRRFLGGEEFIAVMIRTEIGMRNCRSIGEFLDKVVQKWREAVNSTGLSSTFLSVDIGHYGSASLERKCKAQSYAETLFQTIYGDSLNFSNWEQSFKEVSGTTHPAYIGVLQKAVAVEAKCLLLTGGGTFQSHAALLHKQRHQHACILRM